MKQQWNREGKMAWGKWVQYSLLGVVLSSLLFTLCVLAFRTVEPALKPLLVSLWQAASLPPELLNGTGFVTSFLEVVEMLLYAFTLFLAVYLPYERFIREAPQGPEHTRLENSGLV